jgi:hypothetical protein
MRHYQKEWVISQTAAQYFELGQNIGFITVLVPLSGTERPVNWLERIRSVNSQPAGTALSVEILLEKGNLLIGVKNDLKMDIVRDWRRPKYIYKAGRIRLGSLETNGDFSYVLRQGNQLFYTIVNLTKAVYGKTVLFEQPATQFGLAFDGTADSGGIGKVRYWREQIELK